MFYNTTCHVKFVLLYLIYQKIILMCRYVFLANRNNKLFRLLKFFKNYCIMFHKVYFIFFFFSSKSQLKYNFFREKLYQRIGVVPVNYQRIKLVNA